MSKDKQNQASGGVKDQELTTDRDAAKDTPPEAAPGADVPLAPNEGGETGPEPFTSTD